MAGRGSDTKENILEVAESLVMEQGYGSTSIDQILEKTGLTKGAFFYHFKSKSELAEALIRRYVKRDDELLHDVMAKAENLSHDPLQQMIIFVGLLQEILEGLEKPPSCVIASFLYQFEVFSVDTRNIVINGFDEWHRVLDKKFHDIFEHHQPAVAVTPVELVDNFLSLFEGGMILAKMMSEPRVLAVQIRHFRNYLELLFKQV